MAPNKIGRVVKLSEFEKDKFGVKLKYPERTCKECSNYPCFSEIHSCVCDFATYGCIYYKAKASK